MQQYKSKIIFKNYNFQSQFHLKCFRFKLVKRLFGDEYCNMELEGNSTNVLENFKPKIDHYLSIIKHKQRSTLIACENAPNFSMEILSNVRFAKVIFISDKEVRLMQVGKKPANCRERRFATHLDKKTAFLE